jgi:hypothetical protein
MANLLFQNPIIITGPQTSFKAAVAAVLGTLFTLRVARVEFYQPTAVGDTAIIIDPASGKEWLKFTCETALQSQILPVNELWSDFAVDQINSGTLKIFLA